MRRTMAMLAVAAVALVIVISPAAANHRPSHKPTPTPVPVASPTPTPDAVPTATPTPTAVPTPTPTLAPTPSPTAVTQTPVLWPAPPPSADASAPTVTYPVQYSDEYWRQLALHPSGYVTSPCDIDPQPGQTCSDIITILYLYPDGTWGGEWWYVDPSEPDGWSIYHGCCEPGEGF
jgi:hypothetical protein